MSKYFVYDAKGCKILDDLAIKASECSSFSLMEEAGKQAFLWFSKLYPDAKKVLVLCGNGNNAGDGFVFAKYALSSKIEVDVFVVSNKTKFTIDTEKAFNNLGKDKVKLWKDFEEKKYDAIVDAMLGTGCTRGLESNFFDAVNWVNKNENVFSIDVPTGLNVNTGSVENIAVKAKDTITFISNKIGLLTGEGIDICGNLYFNSLNVSNDIYNKVDKIAEIIHYEKSPLTSRNKNSYKGSFKQIVAIGGNTGMLGAIIISGKSALKLGAGKVIVATKQENINTVTNNCLELLTYAIKDNIENLLLPDNILIIGPGLGQDDWSKKIISQLLNNLNSLNNKIILDADGLNLLAKSKAHYDNWILTPHLGEAANLLKCSIKEIFNNKPLYARKLQEIYGGVVILKGAGTLVATSNSLFVCNNGSPVMATSGMGDLLCGIIGSLLAQGLSLEESAKYGVYLHALAGEIYAKEHGEHGLLCTELIPYVKMLIC